MTVVELWDKFLAVGSHECRALNAHLQRGIETSTKGFETFDLVSKPLVKVSKPGLGFSLSLNWLTFMLTFGVVVYSMTLAKAIKVCNLALFFSGMENCGGYLAILKACVLIKGWVLSALALTVPGNLTLAVIEALFHYCVVVRAYGYRCGGDFNGFSIVLEGVLITYLYSIFVVFDAVVSSMFFESCKIGCLVQGRI
ncbi:hypothetical protein GQ457_16G014280 [Hibiscus cannabinus]